MDLLKRHVVHFIVYKNPPCKRQCLFKLQFFRWGSILAVFWTTTKALIHQCLLKSVLSRCSLTVAKWSWGQVTAFCWFHSPHQGLPAYYLMCRWTRFLLGLYGAESHNFHKGTFVMGGCQLLKGEQNGGTSYATMILMSLWSVNMKDWKRREYMWADRFPFLILF